MDILVLILLAVFSSAFSSSKKAKQERVQREREQARRMETLPKEFAMNMDDTKKQQQQPKAKKPSSQQVKPVTANAAKKARPPQESMMGNAKKSLMDKKEMMLPSKGKAEKEQRKGALPQHERKPIVHSTVKQNSVQNRRRQEKDPYGGVACVHGEEAHLKNDLKPNKSPLQLEQEKHKKDVAIEIETFELGMSQKEIVSGIVWGEVLSKPRAYDPRRYGRR